MNFEPHEQRLRRDIRRWELILQLFGVLIVVMMICTGLALYYADTIIVVIAWCVLMLVLWSSEKAGDRLHDAVINYSQFRRRRDEWHAWKNGGILAGSTLNWTTGKDE